MNEETSIPHRAAPCEVPEAAIEAQFRFADAVAQLHERAGQTGERAPRCYIQTFGCQQNEADSERAAGLAVRMGYRLTDDASSAQLILVNTCAIREHAELKALSIIGGFKHVKEKNPRVLIGVCGCMGIF